MSFSKTILFQKFKKHNESNSTLTPPLFSLLSSLLFALPPSYLPHSHTTERGAFPHSNGSMASTSFAAAERDPLASSVNSVGSMSNLEQELNQLSNAINELSREHNSYDNQFFNGTQLYRMHDSFHGSGVNFTRTCSPTGESSLGPNASPHPYPSYYNNHMHHVQQRQKQGGGGYENPVHYNQG